MVTAENHDVIKHNNPRRFLVGVSSNLQVTLVQVQLAIVSGWDVNTIQPALPVFVSFLPQEEIHHGCQTHIDTFYYNFVRRVTMYRSSLVVATTAHS